MRKRLFALAGRIWRGIVWALPEMLDLPAQAGYAHEPYMEWSITTSGFSGDPYDVQATATFTRRSGAEAYTMPLYYAGSNTFKARFTAPKTGVYDVLITSAHAGLNNLTSRADVSTNPNADARGYLTSVVNADGTGSFAHLHGDAGVPRRTLYNSWMRWPTMTSPAGAEIISNVSSTAGTRATHIEALLDGMVAHGMQTYEIVIGHNFVQYPRTSTQTSTNTTPSDTTFTILEDWLERAHARGLALHVWKWLDHTEGGSASNLVGGINGYVDLRIQRYLVGRLGCFPNLTISYSYDLEEWVTPTQVRVWRDHLKGMSNLPRLLFARESQERTDLKWEMGTDRMNTFSWDGRPTNGTVITGHTFWHDAQNPLELYAKPDGRPAGLPMMYEGRFFINRWNRPSTFQYTEENTRRLIWQASMANGVASIIGSFKSPYNVEYTYPERFKAIATFLNPRFKHPLDITSNVDGVAVDGRALANATGSLQLIYKESTSSIQVRVPTGMTSVPVVSVDALAGTYAETLEGTYNAGTHTITLSGASDWALAVGDFGVEPAPPPPIDEGDAIFVSKTGSDDPAIGDGTIQKPYRSLAKAASVVNASGGTITTIYIRGGYYDVIGTDVRLGSGNAYKEYKMIGTQERPITVRSYPGEWAVFDGINHSWWPRYDSDGRAAGDNELLWITNQWVNWEHLEFRNGVGNGVRAMALDCKFRHLVFQNCHATGLWVGGSRNEIAYNLSQDNYSISNGGNSGNGFMLLTTVGLLTENWRFPGETHGADNHWHHNVARNVSDDGFNNITASYDSVYEHNVSFQHGYGYSGNGEGFKMGFKGTYDRNDVFRFNLAWHCKTGMNTNYSTGILCHNNTVWDSGISYALWATDTPGSGDNTAYNNLSLRPAGGFHRAREPGVTVHTHNAGYIGAWDPLGGEGNFDTADVDPKFMSLDWTHADFLRLDDPTSPYLSNGKVITGGSTTLGAIPNGQDFAGGWNWRALVNAFPSHGLKARSTMHPIEQEAQPRYVSKTGNDTTGDGSIANPYRTLKKAVSVVTAGQTIYLRGGVYDTLGDDVYLSGYPGSSLIFSGTEQKRITIMSYPGEWAVIDGKNHARHPRTENDGYDAEDPNLLRFIGEWVTWQDLEMRNGVGKGFHLTGNYNTIKHMRVHHVHSDALYIQGSYNHIEDWLGHDVWSASVGGNAGDSIKLHDGNQIEIWFPGSGTHHNTMLRCGAHNCCDDGFDTISAKNQTWTDCWAFNCGFGPTGNGQGYKMGGSTQGHDNTAVRCIAAYNKVSGFTPNGGARITMHQSTAWGNEIGFDARSSAHDGGEPGNIIVRDNIAYANNYNISRGTSPPYQIVEHNLTTDPAWISTNPAHADFLALASDSAARGYGSAGQDVGALQYLQQFPNAWPLVLDASKRGGSIPTIPAPGSPNDPIEDDALYISPYGSHSGDGSINNPFASLSHIQNIVQPGQTVYMRGGYYDKIDGNDKNVYLTGYESGHTRVAFDGTELKPITVRSYPGEWAIIDGINHPWHPRSYQDTKSSQSTEPNALLTINRWVHWKYFEVRNSVGRGWRPFGLDCKYIGIVIANNGATGWHIEGHRNEIAYSLCKDQYNVWMGGNTGNGWLVNHGDWTLPFLGVADSADNHVHHVISATNSDDGGSAGNSLRCTVEYCVSFRSGKDLPDGYNTGMGSGWKMGRGRLESFNIFRYNVAFDNDGWGFTTNRNQDVLCHNNTSYGDQDGGFALTAHESPIGTSRCQNTGYSNLAIDFHGIARTVGPRTGSEYEFECLAGPSVHERNMGTIKPGSAYGWDDGRFGVDNYSVEDAKVLSKDRTDANFMCLAVDSPARGAGKVVYQASDADIGAIPYGQQFADGWDWRAMLTMFPQVRQWPRPQNE